jgi:large subunit ribosomal protein L18
MESSLVNKTRKRKNRAIRVRKHIRGTSEKPRLSVMKSNQHIAVQLIDDDQAITLASASTLMKEFRSKKLGRSKEAAKQVGAKIAELAKEKDIKTVVFDRGHNKFHGLIAELANAARANGLQF